MSITIVLFVYYSMLLSDVFFLIILKQWKIILGLNSVKEKFTFVENIKILM